MKNKEISKLTRVVLEFIDKEIQKSKMIYEADSDISNIDQPDNTTRRAYSDLFGRERDPKLDTQMTKVPTTAAPIIDPQYSIINKDRGLLTVVDHALLKTSLEMHYFSMNRKTKEYEPKPLLVWGAPGIGKSQAVKEAARNAAREIANQKISKGEVKRFIELKPTEIEEEFSKPLNEIKNNFYFIEWNKISKSAIQDAIILGPTRPSEENEKGGKRLIHQYDLRIPAKNLFIFFDIRVAGMSEQDILGLPYRADVKIERKERVQGDDGKPYILDIPHINLDRLPALKLCCEEKDLHAFIMWDEINQGNDYVQAALYSIILDRQIGSATLAPGVGNFAAANSEMWSGGPLKPALANRFSSCYLYLSPEEWLAAHDKELMPGLKNFIRSNLSISFYISDEGWKKEYIPILRGAGSELGSSEGVAGIEEYIKTPSKGRWPSPRDLTKLNDVLMGMLEDPRNANIDNNILVDRMTLMAREIVGEVFAEHFRKYMYSYLTIRWDMLIDPTKGKWVEAEAGDMSKQDAIREAIYDHFYHTYELVNSPHRNEYKKEAKDILTAICNVGNKHLDFVITTLQKLREQREIIEGKEASEKISKTMFDVLMTGKQLVAPNIAKIADDIINRIKISIAKRKPGDENEKNQFISSPELSYTSPLPSPQSNEENEIEENESEENENKKNKGGKNEDDEIEEKYFKFNKLFEDITSSLTPTQSETTTTEEKPTNEIMMKEGLRSILQDAVKIINIPIKYGENVKDYEARNVDKIKQIILQNTIIPKEQKEKLISRIKNADSAINLILMLKSFLTGAFYLR